MKLVRISVSILVTIILIVGIVYLVKWCCFTNDVEVFDAETENL